MNQSLLIISLMAVDDAQYTELECTAHGQPSVLSGRRAGLLQKCAIRLCNDAH